mmetsp:Transcript_10504/g.28734  ORF Transcript_10504/g.28734 Transcript_10504/m.28734 type:complete len:301 (-) Transcript_10504:45-947(-)
MKTKQQNWHHVKSPYAICAAKLGHDGLQAERLCHSSCSLSPARTTPRASNELFTAAGVQELWVSGLSISASLLLGRGVVNWLLVALWLRNVGWVSVGDGVAICIDRRSRISAVSTSILSPSHVGASCLCIASCLVWGHVAAHGLDVAASHVLAPGTIHVATVVQLILHKAINKAGSHFRVPLVELVEWLDLRVDAVLFLPGGHADAHLVLGDTLPGPALPLLQWRLLVPPVAQLLNHTALHHLLHKLADSNVLWLILTHVHLHHVAILALHGDPGSIADHWGHPGTQAREGTAPSQSLAL